MLLDTLTPVNATLIVRFPTRAYPFPFPIFLWQSSPRIPLFVTVIAFSPSLFPPSSHISFLPSARPSLPTLPCVLPCVSVHVCLCARARVWRLVRKCMYMCVHPLVDLTSNPTSLKKPCLSSQLPSHKEPFSLGTLFSFLLLASLPAASHVLTR